MQAIREGAVAEAERMLEHIHAVYAQRQQSVFQLDRPVGLCKKVVYGFYAFATAEQHGQHAAVLRMEFVLDEWIALVIAAIFIVVVVEEVVLEASLAGDGAAEGAQFPGAKRGIKLDRQESEAC